MPVSALAKDLLHPSPEEEKRKHKKKRLVQSPNSYFMDVKLLLQTKAALSQGRTRDHGRTDQDVTVVLPLSA
ncbi:hypothetical protein Q9233_012722 [Columba guinea]|nr:hypothetical protein Q9233_012722 [Columba guinea]